MPTTLDSVLTYPRSLSFVAMQKSVGATKSSLKKKGELSFAVRWFESAY